MQRRPRLGALHGRRSARRRRPDGRLLDGDCQRPPTESDALFPEPVTALPGFPTAAELADAYLRALGRDAAALGFWIAFAYWKVAIIVEGVYRRWLNDPANGSAAGRCSPAVARLATPRAHAAAAETRLE